MRLSLLLAILPLAVAFAETPQERQAREDLEKQLKAIVGTAPTRVKVVLVGLDQPNYQLIEVGFSLDGRSLRVLSDLKKLSSEGEHLIFHGDVEPGDHVLAAKFEFRNMTSQVVSAEGGYSWKPSTEVAFKAERGIEVQLKVTPDLNLSGDIKNRITVKTPFAVKMIAKLDDGSMPPPADKPNLVLAEVDAGVPVVDKATAAAEAKKKAREDALAARQAAAEEKARLAAEARAKRQAAAEEKARAASEAKAAQVAAAEEKKAARIAAAEEKKAAAEEKKRAAEEAKKPKVAAVEPTPAPVEPPAEVDAGAAEVAAVAEVDAGAVAVAAEPVKPVLAEPVEEPSGIPMPVLIAIGVAVVGLLIFFVARRKKSSNG